MFVVIVLYEFGHPVILFKLGKLIEMHHVSRLFDDFLHGTAQYRSSGKDYGIRSVRRSYGLTVYGAVDHYEIAAQLKHIPAEFFGLRIDDRSRDLHVAGISDSADQKFTYSGRVRSPL